LRTERYGAMDDININSTTSRAANGDLVTTYHIKPNGASHELQELITNLMHDVVMDMGKVTLANLGYLHINTLMYNKQTGSLNLKVFFDPHYCARVVNNPANGNKEIAVVEPLTMFENYLYVGNIYGAITSEKILAPKSKAVKDSRNMASMIVKDNGKLVETSALVLNCSLPITLAAALNISLQDPNFNVSCSTVGRGSKKASKQIIVTSANAEVPVSVDISCTEGYNAGYDPADAANYLVMLRDRVTRANENAEKLKRDVQKKAKKNSDKSSKKGNKGFNKYS